MNEADFIAQWDAQLADWCADDLMRDGSEAALLAPLAAFAPAAGRLVRHAGCSGDHRHRKLAAILAGYIQDPPADLLDELFERESERSALAAPETLEPLYCQSVVEDVVLAAARWCRRPGSRSAAGDLLRKVVERTLVGEYWTTAAYAMATLCRYQASGAEDLLRAFHRFAHAAPPSHPSHPSLGTEREFARGLVAGRSEHLDAVEAILDRHAHAAESTHFEPETQAAVDAWLAAAQRIR